MGNNLAWIVMGDFNEVLHIDDRIGVNPVSMAEIVEFQACVEECELVELPRQAYSANFMAEGLSDHCPVKISLINELRMERPAFKFCNVWTSHLQFMNIVNEGWNQNVEGCQMFRIIKRLKAMKKQLRVLNSQHFRNIITEADEDKIALGKAQAELHIQPLDEELQEQEKRMYQKFRRTSYLDECFLQQRSKINWLQLGDDNTRFFHAVIKHKRLQHTIIQVRDKNGVLQTNQQVIAEAFVEYYQKLLGKKEQGKEITNAGILRQGTILNTEEQLTLVQAYTQKEVNIDINKSPGPDGYGSGFLRAAWSIVGPDVTQAVLEYMGNGRLLN
ncbi:hypothetical protein P3L10_033265 [Capsicum annuum]|uniref:uncharacterized protein LOC124889566 n=1 Tax=Capsicum annuum TaxID=4072 RepID=UPI001FB1691F|nr:uncharacterized protein LOC124889566 [Capsicum annuum]